MTQPWSLERADVIDAGFELECLEPVGQQILGWLADRPAESTTFEDLTAKFGKELARSTPPRTVQGHIDRINEVVRSFERPVFVDVRDGTCVISESGALIVPVALRWLAESAALQRSRTDPK